MLSNVIKKIELSKRQVIDQDVRQTIREMKQVNNPVINREDIQGRNGNWVRPEYDFEEIDRFADIDSYVLQSFRKKLGLFSKEGYDIVGETPELVNYVKKRLAQIAYVSKITERQLISNIYNNLLRFSNCFIALVRDPKSSGGFMHTDPRTGKRLKPIAGMFVIPASTVEMTVNKKNQTERFRQYISGGRILKREYPKDNVFHFFINKKDGFLTGTPRITPVLEDVKALRRIEENVELLVVQNIFPIIHYKVGTKEMPARNGTDGISEVSSVSQEIASMPPEGIYVTPERHELKMIGTEGRALRVETYLDYFKKRVLSGLSMSTVDIGEGGTANRNTADTMSRALVDEVKADQRVFEDFFNDHVINSLLLEANRFIDVTEKKNQVRLRFREIDVDSKIKRENHSIQKWMQNGITHQEFRQELGLNEMTEEEFNFTYHKLITEPQALLSAAGDPGNVNTYTSANNMHTGTEQGDINKAKKAQEENVKVQAKAKTAASPPGGGTVANRNRPANQTGTKTGPAKSLKDSMNILDSEIDELKQVLKLREGRSIDTSPLAVNIYRDRALNRILDQVRASYSTGATSVGVGPLDQVSETMLVRRSQHEVMVTDYVNSLFDDVLKTLREKTLEDTLTRIDAIHYRLAFITRTEKARAFNWGAISGLRQRGESLYNIDVGIDTDEDELRAQDHSHQVAKATLRNIPPWHPNSTVRIIRVPNE